MKKIMIDMDDVITTGGFLYLVNEYLGTNYQYDDFKTFYIQDYLEDKEDFFKWFKAKNIYDYCELLPNAYEVLRLLNEQDKIYIATAYIYDEIINESSYVVLQKYKYLLEKLPFISPHQYIFLSDKSIIDADIKIDDRPINLQGDCQKLLFTAYHNKELTDLQLKEQGIERVNNWEEIKVKLLR